MKIKRLGILGGTFNPIHKGHLMIAEAAKKEFLLDKIIFVPSGLPPHKSHEGLVDKEHRYNMIKAAITGKKDCLISRIELDRKGFSYAIDTFKHLHKEYGKNTILYYIMGLDSINEILSWKKPLELFNICQFIVATRPGSKIKTLKRLLKFPPLALHAGKIHMIELNMDISSSDIRKSIKSGKIPTSQLGAKVAGYIKKNKLYGNT